MPDRESLKLDREILFFIRRFRDRPSDDASFQKLALKVFRFQFRRNKNYRKFCLTQKSHRAVRRWQDIPAMPAAGYKELVLTSFPQKHALRVFKTSGTTTGTSGAHFFDTLRLYDAAAAAAFRSYLLPDRIEASFFYLIHSPAESPHSSLSYMAGLIDKHFAKGIGRFYVRKSGVDFKALEKDLSTCRRKACILTTTFTLKLFLDFLAGKKVRIKLPPGSRLMETGGFKGRVREVSKAALYAQCQRLLGIGRGFCVSEYGMTELSSQFYDTTLKDRFLGIRHTPFKTGPAWTRTIVMDAQGRQAKKGRVGVLRHFDLANRGSVMAVQTEDLGKTVGEGFEILGRAKHSDLRGCSLSYEKFLKS